MYIDKDGNRINIYAPFTAEDGTVYPKLISGLLREKLGIVEVKDIAPPARPDFYFRRELVDAPYVEYVPRPVEQVREILCAEVNARRDALETSGFEFRGKWFQSDQRSFNRIQGMATAASFALASQQPFDPVEWVAEDNSTMVMSAEDIVAFFGALVTHGATVHNKAAILKRYVNRSSFEELVQFNLNEQWPFER